LLQIFLLLLLSVTLPAHGLATLAVIAPSCPMEQGMQADAAARAQHAHASPDGTCCNDADTAAKTGKLCKGGQDCKAGSLGQLPMHAATVILPVRLVTADGAHPARLDASRTRIWRPPSDLPVT
jgi:hypothetical protein